MFPLLFKVEYFGFMFQTLLIVRYFFQNRLRSLLFGSQILFEHVEIFQAAIIEVHLLIFRIVVSYFSAEINVKQFKQKKKKN